MHQHKPLLRLANFTIALDIPANTTEKEQDHLVWTLNNMAIKHQLQQLMNHLIRNRPIFRNTQLKVEE